MKAKELDCVELKDGRFGCLIYQYKNGDFQMELDGKPEIEDFIDITPDQIKRITYNA